MNAMALQAIDGVAKMQQGEFAAPVLAALRNSDEDQKRMAELRDKVNETEKINPIDPDEERKKKEKEQKKRQNEQQNRRNRGPEHGRFIDFTA